MAFDEPTCLERVLGFFGLMMVTVGVIIMMKHTTKKETI